eukprot:5788500-Prymnesium_polylepis.2
MSQLVAAAPLDVNGGQASQALVSMSKNVPRGQGTHKVELGAGWWCPEAQSRHTSAAASG